MDMQEEIPTRTPYYITQFEDLENLFYYTPASLTKSKIAITVLEIILEWLAGFLHAILP